VHEILSSNACQQPASKNQRPKQQVWKSNKAAAAILKIVCEAIDVFSTHFQVGLNKQVPINSFHVQIGLKALH
jgi:hypothetical protein